MRGSSGATILYRAEDRLMYKLDTPATNGRVAEQGHWIKRYTERYPEWRTLPRVNHVFIGGYAMEPLVDNEMSRIPTRQKLQRITMLLAKEIWQAPPMAALDHDDHVRYALTLLDQTDRNDLIPLLGGVFTGFYTMPLWRCLTHGDPIIDNVLHRLPPTGGAELVLIDPIPATSAIPDLMASDVGRLIQSGVGYENARYGFETATLTPREVANTAYTLTQQTMRDHEYSASVYFAIIHMLRGVRTAQRVAPDRLAMLHELVDNLVKELAAWTR